MDHPSDLPEEMAAVVANSPPQGQQPQSGPKRYRPAPAKTFQCRGYGECRMVFSRSEHLARHIRKHTGERPFTCHCGKQFSRLDNLRQHAQTVHADKQDQNERMMRDLTSLHASMAAANKLASARGSRRPPPSHGAGASNGAPSANHVKQEDLSMPLHQRPGTSTGYEGDHDSFLYHQQPSWHVQPSDPKPNNHSFRDSNQSFLGPPSTSPSSAAAAAPGQSFLPFTSSVSFSIPDAARDGRPRTSASRPPTSGGLADPNSRSLPPLAAVVSASLSASPAQQHIQPFPAPPGSSHGQSGSGSVLLPGSLTLRRPTTATRPGTAPASASLFSAKPSFGGGSGMVFSRPELSIQSYGRSANPLLGASFSNSCDPEPPSPGGNDSSPFFFSPPSVDPSPATTSAISSSPATVNPRKRPYPGADGPYDDAASSRDTAHDHEYGSESRPQSRRLSVMELCNDSNNNVGPSTFLLSSSRTESRPTTSGLVSSASALALVDRPSPTLSSSPIQPRSSAQYPTTTSRGNGGGGSSGQEEFGGGRVSSSAIRRPVPSPSSILPYRAGAGISGPTFVHSPTFSAASTASYSPRSPSASPFSPRSPISGPDATSSFPRRTHGDDTQHDQIRFARATHTSPALGLRV